MANAEELTPLIKQKLETFMQRFAAFARAEGGEVSIFDYLDADGAREADPQVVNFIRALQTDIQRIGIADLDIDLDFKPDNVMLWNGKLVMVDW